GTVRCPALQSPGRPRERTRRWKRLSSAEPGHPAAQPARPAGECALPARLRALRGPVWELPESCRGEAVIRHAVPRSVRSSTIVPPQKTKKEEATRRLTGASRCTTLNTATLLISRFYVRCLTWRSTSLETQVD